MKASSTDVGLLLLRLALGSVMWMHGAQKLLGWFGGHGPQGFVSYMPSLGFPPVMGWLVIVIEFFGGLGVVLGVLSRLFSLGFAIQMVVGIVKVHGRAGFFMNWGGTGGRVEGWEFSMTLLAVALALALLGPGRYALFGRTRALLA